MSSRFNSSSYMSNFVSSSNADEKNPKVPELDMEFSKKSTNRQGYNTEFKNASAYIHGYSSTTAVAGRAFANLGKRRIKEEDEYFNDDDESGLPYQPAEGSPGVLEHGNNEKDDDSDDPLDQFMEGIQNEVKKLDNAKESDKSTKKKGERIDLEKQDELESYLKFMEENPNVGVAGDEEEIYEYDAEGNIVALEKKVIDPLPPIDHSIISYPEFSKNFYIPHEDIIKLTEEQIEALRQKLGIKVRGVNLVSPVCSFAYLNLDESIMNVIRKLGYASPTPIQAQGIPIALSGRDIIGIAKTGSGKTAAFVIPMIVHVMTQPELKPGDGPIALICAPTRELAIQIYAETKRYGSVFNLNVICAYGGGNLYEQQKACEAGGEILICTPGRMIDLVKKKSTNLRRVTYLVFDEADKMFNLGFEPQVRSIANHVRPDRQTMLFSATFKNKVEKLARDILSEPIRIVQGNMGEANEDIIQMVEIMKKPEEKWDWLCQHLVGFTSNGSVLIFVTRKINAVDIYEKILARDFRVLLLHGDMHQIDRNNVIQKFKKGEANVLVATDVASRGLDIAHVHTVINYEVARDIDTHTHRVGRTGRAGVKGIAYTLFIPNHDSNDFAAQLTKHLEISNQKVPEKLLEIARKCSWFLNNRTKVFNNEPARPGIGFTPRENKTNPFDLSPAEMRAKPGQITNSTITKPAQSAINSESISDQTNMSSIDRLSVMRNAFAAQFSRRFVAAGVEGTSFVHPERHHSNLIGEQEEEGSKRKKKSRWD